MDLFVTLSLSTHSHMPINFKACEETDSELLSQEEVDSGEQVSPKELLSQELIQTGDQVSEPEELEVEINEDGKKVG